MASGLGYYSGLLEGTKVLRELDQGDRALNLKSSALGLEAQENYSQNSLRQAQRQEILSKLAREEQTAALLQQAMGGSAGTQMSIAGDQDLASQSIAAGKAIIGTDPKVGLELIKAGKDYQKDAVTKELQQIQMQKHKAEMQADIFAGVNSQEELDMALPELAKLGVQIPERYKQWSPETQNWIKNRSIASEKFLKKLQIDETVRAHDMQQQENESKQKYRQEQTRLANQREERAKTKQQQEGGKVKEQTQKTIQMEAQTLQAMNAEFEDLEDGEKVQAARDVFAIAADLKKQNPDWNDAEALQAAREQVIENIQDGEYLGVSIGKPSSKAVSWDTWYEAAKQANPNVPEDQLRAYFDKTYGQ